jgi:hypothetical protein
MGYFNKPLVLHFVFLVANYWNEGYLQSHWPLAAKFGTCPANSLQGSDFAYASYNGGGGGGGILCLFFLLGAIFLFMEIFSVLKLIKKAFWLLWMLVM